MPTVCKKATKTNHLTSSLGNSRAFGCFSTEDFTTLCYTWVNESFRKESCVMVILVA